jgi:hypothetical protein
MNNGGWREPLAYGQVIMHIYDDSTIRQTIWRVQINWSRELTFSERQISFIKNVVPHARGVYCIYAKDYCFDYESLNCATKRWSSVVYIGSGWLDSRLSAHLKYMKNSYLGGFMAQNRLAYRFDRIVDSEVENWPRNVESFLLKLFEEKFGSIPPCNRRREKIPSLTVGKFMVQQSANFDLLARG